jgi:hypothetical protein
METRKRRHDCDEWSGTETCGTCMYCVPCLTPKGTYAVCINADSDRMYMSVSKTDGCVHWYTDDSLEEDSDG